MIKGVNLCLFENVLAFASSIPTAIGIDVNIKDNRGLTALDIVRELPSQKSQHIAALIEGKQQSGGRREEFRVQIVPVQVQGEGLVCWKVLNTKELQVSENLQGVGRNDAALLRWTVSAAGVGRRTSRSGLKGD